LAKKLLRLLRMITNDLSDMEFYSEEMLDTIHYDEPDLFDVG
jgi:hypothetical protein